MTAQHTAPAAVPTSVTAGPAAGADVFAKPVPVSVPTPAPAAVDAPTRWTFTLLRANVGLSVVFLGLAFLFRDGLDPVVWIRAAGVLLLALLSLRWAARMRDGARSAWLRMLWVSVVGPIGIAALVLLPGPYPMWARVEQAVQGLLLLGVAWSVTRPQVRARITKASGKKQGR
ncbi:hypothetical protein [Planotetraspora mira]|uniref:Uncharacterized protein n=1 Tax=Planotetraspora mira TaxID=58121 RepID=A0A8J3TSP8_9ACTN|nr:hypothetical protein [Planotetraspora mira]GII32468.1 hypothetical protein Pmi06nite_59100 [Planotetraspora mira]